MDIQYQNLLKDILDNGVTKKDRTGTGTISVFGRMISHDMKNGFPLPTTKKLAIKSMVTELKWFLKGDTNIQYLVQNGCNIWNGDAYKRFFKKASHIKEAYETGGMLGSQKHIDDMFSNPDLLIILTEKEFAEKIKTDDEFAKEWGELGPIYGKQWRSWETAEVHMEGHPKFESVIAKQIDQIKDIIETLNTNPDSRRMKVNAWNVGKINKMVLPPCHFGFQLYTRELSFDERCDIAIEQGWFTELGKIDVPETHWMLDHNKIPKRAISLLWNQRSVDTFLGLPFNIASYALLLLLFAEEVNMLPERLIGSLGDTHLYLNHIEQANKQLDREPRELPIINVSNVDILNGEFDYEVLGYDPHPPIKAPLSN